MTSQERKLEREKKLAAKYFNARSDMFNDAARSFDGLKRLLKTLQGEVWRMPQDLREAVQVRIQGPLTAAAAKIDGGQVVDSGKLISRLVR
jgi:hypothetical protein